MPKTIVVIGVTGIQGSSVARTFLGLPEWNVRGVTRAPTSDASQALAAEGVEIVQGDLDHEPTLRRAFVGANAIFANTDFFGHLIAGLTPGVVPEGMTANQYAYKRELEQNINIAAAASAPEVLETLDRFILSSLSDASKWSGGKYTTVYHNDVKAKAIRAIHDKHPDLAAKMSTLQVGHYISNWKAFPSMAPQKQSDGSFLTIRPVGAHVKLPFVDTHRDTGSFVKALVDVPAGTDLLGVSESLTWPEWMAIWGQVLGVKAGYKEVSDDEFFQNVPEPLSQELIVTYDYVEEFGYTGGDPDILEPSQLGVKVTSVEEYIKNEDWSSVLGF